MKVILLIIALAGVWVGVNSYKEQPLFSNPFAEKTLSQKALDAGENALEHVDSLFKGD